MSNGRRFKTADWIRLTFYEQEPLVLSNVRIHFDKDWRRIKKKKILSVIFIFGKVLPENYKIVEFGSKLLGGTLGNPEQGVRNLVTIS